MAMPRFHANTNEPVPRVGKKSGESGKG
jgi:hypothetical protein